MDYQVFLLSRIHEEWLRCRDNRQAVLYGLVATARTITAAAAIMIILFCAFVLGPDIKIKTFGFGLAAAVFLDSFVVRSVLVPALMLQFGRANWYLPRWLDRALPQLSVDSPGVYPRPVEADIAAHVGA
jgi:RND superfamily putative drug exporter